jgi:GTP cyclohydrolase I
MQIANDLKETLQTDDVAVIIDADHMCVASRGVNDVNSSTITSSYNGRFLNDEIKKEFLSHIRKS